jgi:hypothetical protein
LFTLTTMSGPTLTVEAKASMIANLELERKCLPTDTSSAIANVRFTVNARKEKLRAMCEAQCASLRSRLERRVNRVPATKRQMSLIELIAPSLPAPKPAPVKAAPTKAAAAKKAPAPAPATRKTRTAPAAPTITKAPAPKPAVAKPAPKQTATRGKKRGSDEMSSEDKENAALDVPKKRVRAAVQKAPVAASKPASRQKTAPAAAQILSPKNNNARQKPAKSSTRSR